MLCQKFQHFTVNYWVQKFIIMITNVQKVIILSLIIENPEQVDSPYVIIAKDSNDS
jgi:hypothetical protein